MLHQTGEMSFPAMIGMGEAVELHLLAAGKESTKEAYKLIVLIPKEETIQVLVYIHFRGEEYTILQAFGKEGDILELFNRFDLLVGKYMVLYYSHAPTVNKKTPVLLDENRRLDCIFLESGLDQVYGKAAELLLDVADLDLALCVTGDGLFIDCEPMAAEVGEGALDIKALETEVAESAVVHLGKDFDGGIQECGAVADLLYHAESLKGGNGFLSLCSIFIVDAQVCELKALEGGYRFTAQV